MGDFVLDMINMCFAAYLTGMFDEKINIRKIIIIAVVAGAIILLCNINGTNCAMFCETMVMILLMKGKVICRIARYIELQMLILTFDFLFFDLGIAVNKISGTEIDYDLVLKWAVIARVIFLMFICIILLSKRAKIQKIFMGISLWASLYIAASLFINLMALGISQIYLKGIILPKAMPVFAICTLLFGILQFVLCIVLQRMIYVEHKLKMLNHSKEELIRQQKHYFEEIDKKNQDLRRFRHDFNNQVYVMNELIKNNKIETLKKYLRDLSEKTECVYYIQTGNLIANMIVNQMYEQAVEEGIEYQFMGRVPAELPCMSDLEFSNVLSNALRNAVEAAKKSKSKKRIWIEAGEDSVGFYIVVENSANRVLVKNDELISEKGDSKNHGIGMKNIREAMKECGGSVEWKYEDYKFSLLLCFSDAKEDQL